MTVGELYTTKLGAGFGAIEETRKLLELWQPGMRSSELFKTALESGSFPNLSARRLLNLVKECFAHRYLLKDDYPASILKMLMPCLTKSEFAQLLFLYTCRANLILADFVKEVYWNRYISGHDFISNEIARQFVSKANEQGKTTKPWSDNLIERVARYLTKTCGDFGLLEPGIKLARKILPFRIEAKVAAYLAYDLHFAGQGDNAIVAHPDWQLFGMEQDDVRNELKNLTLKSYVIVQTAGNFTRISWTYSSWEEFVNVIAHKNMG